MGWPRHGPPWKGSGICASRSDHRATRLTFLTTTSPSALRCLTRQDGARRLLLPFPIQENLIPRYRRLNVSQLRSVDGAAAHIDFKASTLKSI